MDCLLVKGKVYIDGRFTQQDIVVSNGKIAYIGENASTTNLEVNTAVIDCSRYYVFPGFIDVHVHLREPGFSYKETIKTGTIAAAGGGYTAVCSMPNLDPTPDSLEALKLQLAAIEESAVINVYPYGTITKGEKGAELSDMEALSPYVAGFSDDGQGVQSEEVMRKAMLRAKKLGKIIAAHCEDKSLLNGGYIHDGEYARLHNHKGISSESEWGQVERDMRLVKETGCAYHVCHVSTKESVALIRQAKTEGLDVTCETAPHYLVLNDMNLQEDGRFKMNPPIRNEADRMALIEGIQDGTIDMIATDHAPHTEDEKNKGLENSLMGVVGLETAFPILYTKLVKSKIITLDKLTELMSTKPGRRFEINSELEIGMNANFTVFDLNSEYEIKPENFLSMGKSTPFENEKVYGKCLMTIADGKIVYKRKELQD